LILLSLYSKSSKKEKEKVSYMIPENELKDIDGVNQVEFVIPDSQAPAEELVDVEAYLQKFQLWGLNPKGVKVSDFNFQFYVNKYSPVPGFFSPTYVYFAVKHKATGKSQGGFGVGVRSHYATASVLTALAIPDEE